MNTTVTGEFQRKVFLREVPNSGQLLGRSVNLSARAAHSSHVHVHVVHNLQVVHIYVHNLFRFMLYTIYRWCSCTYSTDVPTYWVRPISGVVLEGSGQFVQLAGLY